MEGLGSTVKVGVRVRPFSAKEEKEGCKCVVRMDRYQTTLIDPEFLDAGDIDQIDRQGKKVFTFDFSFWSHKPSDPAFSGQSDVFKDLGLGIVKSALRGYNCSIFAYGQTGSGKSYSMVGYGANRGIVPISCDAIFRRIREGEEKKDGTKYQV